MPSVPAVIANTIREYHEFWRSIYLQPFIRWQGDFRLLGDAGWCGGMEPLDELHSDFDMHRFISLGNLWRKWDWETAFLVIKTALSAGLAWALARNVVHDPHPIFAPLAALFIFQATIYQTVSLAIKRSIGVIVGVTLSIVLGHWLDIHTWTITLLCLFGLGLGRMLRLGPQSVQVAVSALLVLGVSGNSTTYAASRIIETILGGSVGVLFNIVFLPPIHVRPAEQSLRSAAHHLGKTLQRVGFELSKAPLAQHETLELLRVAREQLQLVETAGDSLIVAEESLRLNLRHRNSKGNEVRRLTQSLESIERIGIYTRSLTRSLYDLSAYGFSWNERICSPLSESIMFASFAITRYGDVIDGEIEARERLSAAVIGGREQLDITTQLLRGEAMSTNSSQWELDGSVLAALRRIFDEIELVSRCPLKEISNVETIR